jgi:hypothetical protein
MFETPSVRFTVRRITTWTKDYGFQTTRAVMFITGVAFAVPLLIPLLNSHLQTHARSETVLFVTSFLRADGREVHHIQSPSA